MKYLKLSRKALLFVAIFYTFYLIKSGLGINISHNYHLKDVFIRPVELVKATAHRFLKSPAQTNPTKVSGIVLNK